jgi:hypothetical protein
MGWHVARLGEGRGVYRVLMWKRGGKETLERPRRRWEGNIRMDLQKVECEGTEWTELAQDRDMLRTLENAVMNLWVPQNVGNFLTSCKTG